MTIAGICCELAGLEGELLGDAALMRYEAFLSDANPDLRIDIFVEEGLASSMPDVDQPVVEVAEIEPRFYHICRKDNPFEGRFDLSKGVGNVHVSDNIYCFDSFLRILYSLLLAEKNGLLLHSAAVATPDAAVLLAGVSEAGKTTLCSLGFSTVLSDELVAVRRDGGDFMAYSTPFWGEFVAGKVRDERRVGSVYLLRKGPRHEVRPARAASALFEVLGCVFFFGPPRLSSTVLDIAGQLVESRLGGEFYFTPTSDVVQFLEREVEQHVA